MSGPEISAIPREARPYQGESAGVVSRLVANTIDAAVVWVVLAGCYLGWVALQFLLDPISFTWPDTNWLLSITLGLGLATVYLALAWWLASGRSYGDHVMGLRVVGRRGHKLGPLRCVLRSAFCVFFPIGLFWCVISPKRRSVQDVVLWTKVVYDWTPRPSALERRQHGGEVVESVVVADGSEAAAGSPGAPAGVDEAPRRLRSRTRVAPPAASPGDAAVAPPDHVTAPDAVPADQPDRHDS